VGELAEACASVLGHSNARIERPAFVDGAPDRYVGNGATTSRLAAALGFVPADLDTQIFDTAAFLWRRG
jgi:hypothetical protein